MNKQGIRDIATRHSLILERLKVGYINRFNGYLREWDTLIRTQLRRTGLDKLSEMTQRKAEAFMRTLQGQQAEIFSEAVNTLVKDLPGIASYEAEHEQRVIRASTSKAFRAKVGLPKAKVVARKVMERPVQATGQKLTDFVGDWTRSALTRTNSAIRLGIVQGQTVRQVVKALLGSGDLFLKDGQGAVTKRHAHTVVRTSIQHATSTGRAAMYEENEDLVERYEWVSTLDDKTSTVCRSLDGQKYKLGQGPMPPIHPNCRSTTIPVLGKEWDFLDKGATRSAQTGPVSAEETYYQWLKRQDDPELEIEVLGLSRAKLFREGGLTEERFRALQIDKNFEPLTLEEMRKLEPKAFARAGI